MMLDAIFSEFINVVQENNKYVIGLLNNEGRVISCSQPALIDYHFDVRNPSGNEMFYPIDVKGKNYGFLWVSGEEESLKMIGGLLLESLTTRILYDINETLLKQKVTKDDELLKCLLDQTSFNMNQILDLVAELGIDKDKPRVALYVTSKTGFNPEEIVRLKLRPDSKEIIYSLLDSSSLLIFKDIEDEASNRDLKQRLRRYIRELQEWGLMDCHYYIGSMQNKLTLYVESYQNCLWLRQHVHNTVNEPAFFTDRLFEYYVAKIAADDVHHIFGYYKQRGREIDTEEFVEIARSLLLYDFNITQTADDLFLHKNTLIYKLKRYEEVFDLDIRGSFQGKMLLLLIANALYEKQKREQVGEKS